MRDADYADKVEMFFTHIGRSLDLRGTTLGDVDLSRASIGAALQLGGMHESAAWKQKYDSPGTLDLRNAHAGQLMNADESAWPAKGQLRLEGFTFDHLGGHGLLNELHALLFEPVDFADGLFLVLPALVGVDP